MRYSVVIPAHNEAENFTKLLSRIKDVFEGITGDYEIIVVNDNSTDNSAEVLNRLKKRIPQLKPVYRTREKGVGNALREGIRHAKGEFIITMDCDVSHDPRGIPALIEALESGYDLVCGSRYVKGGRADMAISRIIISRAYNLCLRLLLGIPLKDFTSGFRAYRGKALHSLRLEAEGFGIFPEIPLKMYLHGYRVGEVAIRYYPRQKGKSKLSYIQQGPDYLKTIVRCLWEKPWKA